MPLDSKSDQPAKEDQDRLSPEPEKWHTSQPRSSVASGLYGKQNKEFNQHGMQQSYSGCLKPIVEQESAMSQIVHSWGAGFKGLARQDQTSPSIFKQRLTSAKRPPDTKHVSRIQQLLLEPLQSDSPKGLDQALTPAMFEALQSGEGSPLSASTSPSARGSPGAAFQCSFTRRYSAKQPTEDALEEQSDTTASASHSPVHPVALEIKPADPFATATATISLAGQGKVDILGLKKSPRLPSEDDDSVSVTSKIPASRTPIAQEGQQQPFLESKWLRSITVASPADDATDASTAQTVRQRTQQYVRTNISRTSQRSLLGASKPSLFQMYSVKGREKMSAEREAGRQTGFAISTSKKGTGKVVANLIAIPSVSNMFLLLRATPGTPGYALDAEQASVIMAVCFEKSRLTGQRLATVLVSEERRTSVDCADLGTVEEVMAYFQDYKCGKHPANLRIFTSVEGLQIRNARSTRASTKGVQLQEASKVTDSAIDEEKKRQSCCFEFGRLRHRDEFVCDFMRSKLSPVQAMGLAVACSTPRQIFM